jgi:hypothetical protein
MYLSPLKLVVLAAGFEPVARRLRSMWGVVREFAPYAAIELILPGGTVIAILCWMYRRRAATRKPTHGSPHDWRPLRAS